MPGGVGVLDMDGDGRMDLILTLAAAPPKIYRNTSQGWEDKTAFAGIAMSGYSMAVATADFDNDGRTDVLLTSTQGVQLFRNVGGRFQNVTHDSGLGAVSGWVIGAGWFDYDRDGRLDLFLVRYVQYDPTREPFCGAPDQSYRTYCHPRFYPAIANLLFHNEGDGRFRDVSLASGIAKHLGKGMAVAFGDADGDGWLDVLVTNDTVPNFLFRNQHDGTFREMGATAGVAWNDDGLALSSMGVDFRDLDGDGKEDIFITALANEAFPLFRQLVPGQFEDASYRLGIAGKLLPYSGWSTGAFDFDNDGRREIFVAAGDVQNNAELYSSRQSRQPCILLKRTREGQFSRTTVTAPGLHRGAAFGDFQNQGCISAVISRLGEPPVYWRPDCGGKSHWLGVILEGTRNNRQGLGALVVLNTASGTQINRATTAVGYASASDSRVHFGLGGDGKVLSLEVQWPDGYRQTVAQTEIDQYVHVKEDRPTR